MRYLVEQNSADEFIVRENNGSILGQFMTPEAAARFIVALHTAGA